MNRLSNEALSALIGDIYDCVLNPYGWTPTMTKIASSLDCAYTTISLAGSNGYQSRMAAHSPWDIEQLRILNEEYGIEGIPGLSHILTEDIDRPFSTLQNMREKEFHATPFYQKWAKPQGLRDGCIMKFVHTAERIGVIAGVTYASRDIISKAEQQFMALLGPHLRRAAMIGDLLDHERVARFSYKQTLEKLAVAVILTNDKGAIDFANLVARNLFSAGQLITSKNGILNATNLKVQKALESAIAMAAHGDLLVGNAGNGLPLSLPDENPAVAYVLPLTQGVLRRELESQVAVFIAGAPHIMSAPETVLCSLFNLTHAEARALAQLGNGVSTEKVLSSLNISEATMKTHISRILNKTGKSNRSELVKMMSLIGSPLGMTGSIN